ncbi:methylenetetrahydrofolate reductase [Hoeflea sp. WL0058]|uniref:Methylenetetrahydrofolate reductase n=1 Tax=Flavimaribacter sediminis TaxID=2865987 RepID=A0AAE2ZK34_9HYPH|nr:methylenetetrahydrofolate reductase [Flavimaribacter sediminis]MBW8635970.1 methylenetetrahydrofolate reductase [Flavimaribacter sediminis]
MTKVINIKPARPARIAASIEVAPKQAIESADLPGLFPEGAWVYITEIGTDSSETLVKAAKRVRDLGYEPVPHFASRRLTTREALETRIRMMTEEAGVKNVLVIGGGLERQAGDFSSTMEVLETGFFDKYGVDRIGVAGHPEGSPDFTEEVALQALRLKKSYAERSDASMRIVTQFGFDAAKFIAWADGLKANGIDLPVHLGVAGPAKITTLIKYAAMCGVGNSIGFLKKNAMSLTALATSHSPETVVGPIEDHVLSGASTPIRQIHVFAFGGLKKTSEWLVERGSWQTGISADLSLSSLQN